MSSPPCDPSRPCLSAYNQSRIHGIREVPVQGHHRPLCEPRLLERNERLDRYRPHRLHRLHRRRNRLPTDTAHLFRPCPLPHDHKGRICHRSAQVAVSRFTVSSHYFPSFRQVHHIDENGEDAGVVYSEMQGRESSAGDIMALECVLAVLLGRCNEFMPLLCIGYSVWSILQTARTEAKRVVSSQPFEN